MPLPSFLCIGAQKAGTSWLFVQLAKHPDIWMPPVKELHLFDHIYVEKNRMWTTGHIRKGVLRSLNFHLGRKAAPDWSYIRYLADFADNRMFTDAWYMRCFDRAQASHRVCGDITPEYSTIPPEGIEHVQRLMPRVKILYIIRDPVERALSQLRMNVERRNSPVDEASLLQMCDEPDIDNRGDYRTYVPRWRSYFPPEQMLILPYGDIRADSASFMNKIENFLGVPPFARYDFESKVHESKEFPIPEAVRAKFTSRYAEQRRFLAQEFGEDFLARTR